MEAGDKIYCQSAAFLEMLLMLEVHTQLVDQSQGS